MDKIEAKKVFGENLKRLRIARGMSQDELAKALGYTNRSSINKIELGKNDMPRNKIVRAAAVLGVSPLELFQGNKSQTDTLPGGGFHGGEPRPDILIDFDQLSDKNKEQAMTYIKYLLETQKGEEKT